jgi:uncharacterized protein YigE (DUF2233 family)
MKKAIALLIVTFILSCTPGNTGQVTLSKGLYYNHLLVKAPKYNVRSGFDLFYVVIDPSNYKVDLLLAKDYDKSSLQMEEYLKLSHAIITINGSFFDKNYRPLGLLVKNNKLISKLRKQFDGVFYIKDSMAKIVHSNKFKYDKTISFAVQSRPRLVYKGKPMINLKRQIARRSFIGIKKNNFIVIGITENTSAYADDLAKVLALKETHGGVGCEYALNLDGGSSSQFYINYNNVKKKIGRGFAVPNAIGIFKQ